MTSFYVSTTGSDSADGLSAGTAFLTLERAQLAMRGTAGQDTTFVRGGTYEQRQTLVLTAEDSGSSFVAYGDERPTISGGAALTEWTEGADGIWTARLEGPDLSQLTLNGVRQTEARYPNEVPSDPVQGGWLWGRTPPAGISKDQQLAIDLTDLAQSGIAVGMKVHLFTDASWSSSTLTVTAVDAATGVVSFDEPADFELGAATRYFVQDAKVHLDQPGEWWFDAEAGLVHFKAPPGFDGTGVVASGNHTLIRIEDASDVTIRGFTLSDQGTAAHNAGIGEGGIVVQGGVDVTIADNHFVNLAMGVYISDGSTGTVVEDNRFEHLWSSAVLAGYGTTGSTIQRNDIRWVDEVFVYEGAISLSESWGNLVSHNLVRDVPRMGISGSNYDPRNPSGNNIIEFNTVLRAMQQTSDGGSIYTWSGSDRRHDGDIYRYNRIIDSGGLEAFPGGFRPGQEYSNGIYLDDFTSNSEVYGNMVEGSVRGGIYLHGGSYNTVFNNIVLGNKDIGIQFFEIREPMLGNEVYNNIVEATLDDDGNTVELNPDFVAPDTLQDNFYWNPRNQTLNFSYETFAQMQAAGYDLGSLIFAGALFVDPASGNWALRAGSPPLTGGFDPLPLGAMAGFDGGRIVLGTAREDQLAGRSGGDVLEGFDGADRLRGAAGDDDLTGGAGADSLLGQAGDDAFFGGDAGDLLRGGAGNDRIWGELGADLMAGGEGRDWLAGGVGRDTIRGGDGVDTLTGGIAGDVFVFAAVTESGMGFAQRDKISDFQDGRDRIDLSDIDADPVTAGDQAFRLGTGRGFDGLEGALRVVVVKGDTLILADRDGDRRGDFSIQLEGVHGLTALDFML